MKNIWITGATSGIGKALAIRFAQEGWQVAASARRENLLNEISELNRVPNKDYSLINLKIREYIESNKINHIDREIASLKNRENIDYIVMESPKISKPSSGETSKKKRVLKKKPAAAAIDIPEPSATEEVEEKPKKKKIIRKKKTKGGSAGKIDIDGLLDIVEDDINIETIETKNDNDENDLTKMISENLPEEEKVLVGGDSEIDLDLDLVPKSHYIPFHLQNLYYPISHIFYLLKKKSFLHTT